MNHLARLQWQCRRGTKELDYLLQRYLATDYLLANDTEKALFIELLKLEDDELLDFLIGDLEMSPREMRFLVEKIRAFVVPGV
jgi:antitoxin CptB